MISMIKENYNYILKHLSKVVEKENCIHLFGHAYNVVVKEEKTNHIYIENENIIICTKNTDSAYISKLLKEFYKTALKDYIDSMKLLAEANMGLTNEIFYEYKDVKTYFGECFWQKNLVIFSLNLAKYDKIFIDSVLYHELAHFYYHNHSEDFYNLLERKFKGYKRIRSYYKKIKYNDLY